MAGHDPGVRAEVGVLTPDAPPGVRPLGPAVGFSSLEQQLTTYVCYAHVFGDALTFEELVSRSGHPPERVRATLDTLVRSGRVAEEDGFFLLPGRSGADHVTRRAARQELAEQILAENRRFLTVVSGLPFVRVVAVSGSVAVGNPTPAGERAPDCDLFIITADHSLHIVRLVVRLLARIGERLPWLGLVSGTHRPCANYFLEESVAEIENESLYTATEAMLVRVLKGHDAYQAFLRRNPWIGRYYAAASPAPIEDVNGRPGRTNRILALVKRTVNLACFAVLAARLGLRTVLLGAPFSYSIKADLQRDVSLRRARPAAGGYQALVRKRFAELYGAHFGHHCSEEYLEYLFPRTRDNGIMFNGRLFEPSAQLSLSHYDGLLPAGR